MHTRIKARDRPGARRSSLLGRYNAFQGPDPSIAERYGPFSLRRIQAVGRTRSLVVRANVVLGYDNGLRHFVRFRGLDPRQNIDAMRIRYLHGKAE